MNPTDRGSNRFDRARSASQADAPPEDLPRRKFLLRSASLTGAALAGATLGVQRTSAQSSTSHVTLRLSQHPNYEVVGRAVLPTVELGQSRTKTALDQFSEWLTAFEPVAELDHGYLSSDEINYGPADPRPLWLSQLEALDLEAQQRFATTFSKLSTQRRDRLLAKSIDRTAPGQRSLPRPEYAPHVALALMAWYLRSSSANDLCYRARIGRHQCRGMRTVSQEPRPLPARATEQDAP